jgi:hypothetical protein
MVPELRRRIEQRFPNTIFAKSAVVRIRSKPAWDKHFSAFH